MVRLNGPTATSNSGPTLGHDRGVSQPKTFSENSGGGILFAMRLAHSALRRIGPVRSIVRRQISSPELFTIPLIIAHAGDILITSQGSAAYPYQSSNELVKERDNLLIQTQTNTHQVHDRDDRYCVVCSK